MVAGTPVGYDLDHSDSIALLQRQTHVLELIASGASLTEVLTAVAEALEELIEDCHCSILLLDPCDATLHHGVAPSLPAAYCAGIEGMRIGADAGSCGAAAYLGTPVVAEDIATDPRWRTFRELAIPHGLRACWSRPIRGRTGTLGTFAVYHPRPHQPLDREQRLVERFTHLASVAIDHAGLFTALADSEERFRRAFEDNAVGMALTEPDGTLVKVNRTLREMFGRTEFELLGTGLWELVTPTAADERRAELLDRLAAPGVDGAQFEALASCPDGRALLLAVAASAVRTADGAPGQLIVNILDITQQRAAERDRRARREAEVARGAAEAASRAKSEFVSALSHELRTPLQAITGFTELLGSLDLPAGRRQAALGHIGAATGHILSMVDDVLDIAKIEAGALSLQTGQVDLAELIGEVLDLLQPLADERGVALRRGDLAATARADGRRLRQILINLVTNGIRYNQPRGWVRISVERTAAGVTIAVRDSGRGIPAEQIERLFVPFDRLDADTGSERGVGLGLVLARGLTEAMAGELTVHSVVGAGTTVGVALPAAR